MTEIFRSERSCLPGLHIVIPALIVPLLLSCPALAQIDSEGRGALVRPFGPAQENAGGLDKSGSNPAKDDVEVERCDFGIVTDRRGPPKKWKLHPVVVIPNLSGVRYAWKLKVKPQSPVFVREEFSLPEAPSTWKLRQGELSAELLKGGEQCVLENFQPTDAGWIGHSWTASAGDPPGRYQIKIFLNGKLAHIFNFNVGEAQEEDKTEREL